MATGAATLDRPNLSADAELVLHLARIEHLFVAPDFSPLDPRWHERPGVENLRTLWKRDPGIARFHLVIRLPPSQVRPELREAVQAALKRYCADKIAENEADITLIRTRARGGLLLGLLVLGLFLALIQVTPHLPFVPSWLGNLLSESWVIAGWVALWGPFESWLYEWRPNRIAIDFYRQLSDASLAILPEGARPADQEKWRTR